MIVHSKRHVVETHNEPSNVEGSVIKLKGNMTLTTVNGHMNNGRFTGKGKVSNPSGGSFTYDGDIVDNEVTGTGIAKYGNGNLYEGSWFLGKRNGRGVLRFKNGGYYEGQFTNDEFEGAGTFVFSNGESYIGQFSKSDFNGYGTFSSPNDGVKKGLWRDGIFIK